MVLLSQDEARFPMVPTLCRTLGVKGHRRAVGTRDCKDLLYVFAAVIERGHRDGTIDPDLPVTWVQYLLWSQLYAGWSYIAETGASRHEALRLLVRTFVGAIRP